MVSVLIPCFQDKVRSQDSVFVVAGVTGSVAGRDQAWKYVKDHWKTFIDRYEGGFLLSRLVKVRNRCFSLSFSFKHYQFEMK
jgi:puromycin-sensitive aminopeptidase